MSDETAPTTVPWPREDRLRSPRTGWTRDHWEALADRQLLAARRHASPGGAVLQFPGNPSHSGKRSDGLEGYARTFLLAAFRVAGAGGDDPWGHLDLYRRGVVAGTAPGGAEAWLPMADMSQPTVEAASIAIGLHLTRPWLWDTLEPAERDATAAWLGALSGKAVPDNNWVLFRVVVQEFLASVGYPYHQPDIDHGLARAEDWYLGNGWYRDGDGDNFDYYVGWAMHLYPVLWAWMARTRDPELAQERLTIYRERLGRYLGSYVRMFGGTGAPVFQGRSLIYRFATTAPLWLGELVDASPLPSGTMRGLASAAARYFVGGGALGDDDVLSRGWLGSFPPMAQHYSGPASPYWASKGFMGLLLPPDSPAWTDPEGDPPVTTGDRVEVLAEPGFVLASTAADGIVRVLNHGSDHHRHRPPEHEDPHYSRFAYSTHTAPAYLDRPAAAPADNSVCLLDAQGRRSWRTRIHRVDVAAGLTASAHHPVWSADEESASPWTVVSAVDVRGSVELRVHVVLGPGDPEADGSTPVRLRIGGYAVAADEPIPTETATVPPPAAVAVTGELRSEIVGLHGGTGAGIVTGTDASPFGHHVAVPELHGLHPGGRSVIVVAVQLTGTGHEVPLTGTADVTDDADGVRATLTLPDDTALTVALTADALEAAARRAG